ncbi:MAG: hypothetical protein HZA90_11170 [Verrucomicrobia bacterium]|nr:hypothetical protein [Verrucomicrobiota bacterium]
MTITRQTVAEKLAAYLRHETPLVQLVDWAESAVMDGEFPPAEAPMLTRVVARLGVADVRAFGLTGDEIKLVEGSAGLAGRASGNQPEGK